MPVKGKDAWLVNSEEGIEFLKRNAVADEVVVYASMPHAYIRTVLVSASAVTPPDHDDLLRADPSTSDTWSIEHSWGAGGDKIALVPPLGHPGCNSLVGAEAIIFRRTFHGMRDFNEPIEPNQKLVHCFNLFFMEERKAWCRLNDKGDIEDIVRLVKVEDSGSDFDQTAVLITAKDLAEYMAVTGQVLFRKFDFSRFEPSAFPGWDNGNRRSPRAPDLAYEAGVSGRSSFVNGFQIIRAGLTVEDMVAERRRARDPEQRKYEAFKIQDWKNNRHIEVSCGPDGIANYFTKSDKPYTMSPAFFRGEVLQRYKADPDKYEIRDRTITCRNAWSLKTYDINEQGQVHTYIGYLGDLPHEEQQYWKLFNEWPKGPISKRAYQTDFEGRWDFERDPLFELKRIVHALDKASPKWWKARGEAIAGAVLYPASASAKEWGGELLHLDQLLVEGFLAKELRAIAHRLGAMVESNWQSLKLVEVVLIATGTPDDEARGIRRPASRAPRNAEQGERPRRRSRATRISKGSDLQAWNSQSALQGFGR